MPIESKLNSHMYELILQISENTDLSIVSLCYTFDSLEVILRDKFDEQKYHFSIKPTAQEKL